MSVKTIATLFCSSACAFLLLALLLQSWSSIRDDGQAENAKIPIEEETTPPETITPQGKIRGINMRTRHNRKVFGFIGIPYAQPPVGDLRFKSPLPARAWNGTFDANSDTEPCPQFNDDGELSGNEDCLHLNVFTPQLPASDDSPLLPVMMYIIGGQFQTGNNSIDRFVPDFVLDKDVILIFPNFRLGVLGFLSTGDEVSPGNYGLKDIVQALKWVQTSIQYFGGDPNRVTILGGSSGAVSVHLLALSPLTDGLIHRYITQSGTALSVACQPRELSVSRAIQLGGYFGCPTNTSILLVNCLRGVKASELINSKSFFYVWGSIPSLVWLPTTEPDIEGALLTDTPANLYAAGKIRDLPWIASVNRDEGLVFSIPFYENPAAFEDFLENIDLLLPEMLLLHHIVSDVAAYTTAVKSYYLTDLTANRSILLTNFTKLVGDAMLVYPTYNAFRQQLVLAKNPQFLCSFEYEGVFSLSYFFSRGSTHYKGVAHGDEFQYLFGHQGERFGPAGSEFSEVDLIMVDTMVQLWTSFATNGFPSMLDSNGTPIWEPYSSLNNYLRIGNGSDPAIEMKYDLFLERMQFWDELTAAMAT